MLRIAASESAIILSSSTTKTLIGIRYSVLGQGRRRACRQSCRLMRSGGELFVVSGVFHRASTRRHIRQKNDFELWGLVQSVTWTERSPVLSIRGLFLSWGLGLDFVELSAVF